MSKKLITPEAANHSLKKHTEAVGIENHENFSSHSMRRGLATTASREGVSLPAIMRQGRWKQVSTMMEYIEAAATIRRKCCGSSAAKNVSAHRLNSK